MNKKLIALCILDGWGIAPKTRYNAITNAKPKFFNYLLNNFPHSKLQASESFVGLPEGQMGNSEVGHMIIGSGRTIIQDLPRINEAISTGNIFKFIPLIDLKKKLMVSKKACHIIGLASDGAVHSHYKHMLELSKFIAKEGIQVHLHCITDGRDTFYKSASKYLVEIENNIKEYHNIKISTIGGRYYAMDRDNRDERTNIAYKNIVKESVVGYKNVQDVINDSYKKNITDEFIYPKAAENYPGVKSGDALIFTNFRADRMRQITNAIIDHSESFSTIITMTNYSKEISKKSTSLFAPQEVINNLSDVLNKNSIKQLRAAETEKYPHVTFFFDAGHENNNKLEKKILVDSPKVSTYDHQPEMSAVNLTDEVIKEISTNDYNFLLINYANTDMVGHTGNYHATLEAVKEVDNCLERLYKAVHDLSGTLIVTADHGNAEEMFNEASQEISTSHTTNPVPFIVATKNFYNNSSVKILDGTLADIAPSILHMYGIKPPKEMSGNNLIIR